MKKENNVIELKPIDVKFARIFIEGDGDLVLNKMNARTIRQLTDEREDRKTIKEIPNVWEDIATAISWRDTLPVTDTKQITQEMFMQMLKENAPCISAFGLKKSFGQAVVQNEIDTYSTKFNNAMNVIAPRGLVPVKFSSWSLDERLMSPKRGAPVLVRINHFSGWSAEFDIKYTEHVYSIDQIVNIINLAGFGLGIGSGRTSGYGRYHVVDAQ